MTNLLFHLLSNLWAIIFFYQSNILQISEKKILVLFAADAFNLNNLPNEDPWRPEIPEGLSNIILSIVLVSLMKISIPTRTGNQY